MRVYKRDGRKQKKNKNRRVRKPKEQTSSEDGEGGPVGRNRFLEYDLTSLCAEDFKDMQEDMYSKLALSYEELEKLFEDSV